LQKKKKYFIIAESDNQEVSSMQKQNQQIQLQQRSYLNYAHAAEAYSKKPTSDNWEKKEKAFENFNALLEKIARKTRS